MAKTVQDNMREALLQGTKDISVAEMIINEGNGMNPDKVNALLYVIGMVLSRESEKYKRMEVQLCYNYLPIDKKFTNVIFYNCKVSETETADGKICFDNGADFLDIMAELLTVLKTVSTRVK